MNFTPPLTLGPDLLTGFARGVVIAYNRSLV